jgi:hypothetical protein
MPANAPPPSRFHTPYARGTPSYERARSAYYADLRSIAERAAVHADTPDARRKFQRRAAQARRAIHEAPQRIERAEERAAIRDPIGFATEKFRQSVNYRQRRAFNKLPSDKQRQFIAARLQYPDGIPRDIPDPFADKFEQRTYYRGQLWNSYYASRAAIRQRGTI